MLKDISDTSEQDREALKKRLHEAINSLQRGGKTRIANRLDVSSQAITGWLKTGRIDKKNLAAIAEITNTDLNWLITGNGPQKTRTEEPRQTYQATQTHDLSAHWGSLSPKTRAFIEELIEKTRNKNLKDQDIVFLQQVMDKIAKD